MRRKERHILNGALIVGGATAIVDVLMQWKENSDNGVRLTWDNFNGVRTLKRTLVGATAGGVLGYAYYRYRLSEEEKLPFNPDGYLRKLLTKEHLKADPTTFSNILKYRENIKLWMSDKFGNKLVSPPEDTGSFFKRTAINSNYDLDIVLPFRKESYSTLEEMYYNVYNEIESHFGGKAIITKQTKAIGITFENDGNPIQIDVVPGREINDYKVEKNLNLFVKPEWIWQRGRSFKTNVNLQKKMTVNKPGARTVIKLLKLYRDKNNLYLPTIMIEQCVVEAMSENNFGEYSSTSENLLNSMDFIAKKLELNRLIDIANSNNNLNEKLSDYQRIQIIDQFRKDIDLIEQNPRCLREVFEC